MSMPIVIKWYGRAILKGVDMQNKKLVLRIAQTVSRKAKLNLYPGHGLVTANLKRSIRAVTFKGEQVVMAGGDTGVAPGVSSPVDYAGHVELGTSKMAARAYMRPAADSFSKSDLNRCVESVKEK